MEDLDALLVRRTHTRRSSLLAAAIMLAVGVAAPGFAATLAVTSTMVTSTGVATGSGAPTVFAYDNFDRATTVNPFNGTASQGGLVWQTRSGSFRITAADRARANGGTSSYDNTDLDVNAIDRTTIVTLFPQSASPTAGLSINNDGDDRLTVLYSYASGGTLTLHRVAAGPTRTVLATATGVGTFNATTPMVLKVVSAGAAITVSVNATVRITHTLTGTDLCRIKDVCVLPAVADGVANDSFGIAADMDASSRFEDFRIESN